MGKQRESLPDSNINGKLCGFSWLDSSSTTAQNLGARSLVWSLRDPISPTLARLHWLPILQRIQFKILVLTYKALHGLAPPYPCDLLTPYQPARSLRSAGSGLLRTAHGHGSPPPGAARLRRQRPEPGEAAPSFQLDTLDGPLAYPLREAAALLFHAFTNKSGFLECLWTAPESLGALVAGELPDSSHVLFMSFDDSAAHDVRWMKQQLVSSMEKRMKDLLSRLHFVPVPIYALGNWIPELFYSWTCKGHNCGFSQAIFTSPEWEMIVIAKRLDARYDWLMQSWKSEPYLIKNGGDGCSISSHVKDAAALVSDEGNCSHFAKVQNMALSGAAGVLVYVGLGQPLQDMNCEEEECSSFVFFSYHLHEWVGFTLIQYRKLSEMGWFLYPTFKFMVWQAQWFNYMRGLDDKLQRPAIIVNVFNEVLMQGDDGVFATVELPEDLSSFNILELDASLSCPGTRDESCAHWDHTVQLYVCCEQNSSYCNLELGRWITPFRRRVGHWLTDVSPLLPLLNQNTCTFNIKTAPWAMPWKPSLNLRFSESGNSSMLHPFEVKQLFTGGTFDRNYNKKYQPIKFVVPSLTKKVELYVVITGHGSDENGCGEFCVTSHYFVINSKINNSKTFDNAGTAFGCADKVLEGVVPNEHGTWLYGRNGWCDGQDVAPWRTDVTDQVNLGGINDILYFGLFEGKDPDPKQNPGYIILYSYLIFYK
uniref:Si:dkey-256h2.1 n=1 Tax=Callorhinchus milii TaxID=7868 RepID=A0A4W3HJL8_CALMI